MLFRSAALALALSALVPTSANAFNCSVPAIFSAAKKAVCASALLSAKDRAEQGQQAVLRSKFGADVMPMIATDRKAFISTRDICGSDRRCLEATYNAQLRLYRKLDGCRLRGDKKLECVSDVIRQHRQELHKSM